MSEHNDNNWTFLTIGLGVIVALILFFMTFASVEASETGFSFTIADIEPWDKGTEKAIIIQIASDACPYGERAMMLVVSPTYYIDEIPNNNGCSASTISNEEAEWLGESTLDYLEHGFFPVGGYIANMTTGEYYAWADAVRDEVMDPNFRAEEFGPFHINNIESGPGEMTIYFGQTEECPRGETMFSFEVPSGNPIDFTRVPGCNATYHVHPGMGAGEDGAGWLVEKTVAYIQEGHRIGQWFTNMTAQEYTAMVNEACDNAGCDDVSIDSPPTGMFMTFLSFISR
jgi:hypothetical protein